jgi:hypothetical protein
MNSYDLDTPEGMKNAIAWQRQMVASIKDGGVWIVPRSMSIYTVYNCDKAAERTVGGEDSIDRVFRAMGWTVQ